MANGDSRSSIDLGSVGGTLTSWKGEMAPLVTELPQQSTLATEATEDRWAQIRGEKKKGREE